MRKFITGALLLTVFNGSLPLWLLVDMNPIEILVYFLYCVGSGFLWGSHCTLNEESK